LSIGLTFENFQKHSLCPHEDQNIIEEKFSKILKSGDDRQFLQKIQARKKEIQARKKEIQARKKEIQARAGL